eukprot:1428368-Amphidinium_carterae.1
MVFMVAVFDANSTRASHSVPKDLRCCHRRISPRLKSFVVSVLLSTSLTGEQVSFTVDTSSGRPAATNIVLAGGGGGGCGGQAYSAQSMGQQQMPLQQQLQQGSVQMFFHSRHGNARMGLIKQDEVCVVLPKQPLRTSCVTDITSHNQNIFC